MKASISLLLRGAIPVLAGLFLNTGAQSQTLNGIRIGEAVPSASRIGAKPIAKVAAGPHEEIRWKLPDGNRLSLATDPDQGKIVYAEEKWGGRLDGKPADFPGFKYGETTLADIRAHAENNGFAFVERLLDERPDGLRLFNAYEVEGAPGLVVTFVTKMPPREAQKLRRKAEKVDINRSARLESIILADAAYLESIWGEAKLKGKSYKPIRWASTQDQVTVESLRPQ
jgi:hypothetical protein